MVKSPLILSFIMPAYALAKKESPMLKVNQGKQMKINKLITLDLLTSSRLEVIL